MAMAQQDYWRGGWANVDLSSLPGTQGARNTKGFYGPINALADILGAYIQKSERDKANKAIDEYESGFDANMAPPEQNFTMERDALGNAIGVNYPQQYQIVEGDPIDIVRQKQEAQAGELINQTHQPLSYRDYASKANGMKAQLLRRLQKNGLGITPEMVDYVNQVTQDKINAYGNQRLQELSPQVFQNGLSQMGLAKWYPVAMEYKQIADQLGIPFDPAQYLATQAMKIGNVDTGGRIVQQAAPANGLPIGYDENGVPVYTQVAGTMSKSMTPAQVQQAALNEKKFLFDQYDKNRNFNEKVHNNEANLKLKQKDVDSNVAYRDWKINNGGSGGKMGNKEQGALQGIKDQMAVIENAADPAEARAALKTFGDSIEEAIGNGYIKGDDVDFFRGVWRGKRAEYYKRQGQEDEAAWEFSQIPREVWKELYEPQYGKQPYK
jgi:hypothetical protein